MAELLELLSRARWHVFQGAIEGFSEALRIRKVLIYLVLHESEMLTEFAAFRGIDWARAFASKLDNLQILVVEADLAQRNQIRLLYLERDRVVALLYQQPEALHEEH